MTHPQRGWAFDELSLGQEFRSRPHVVTADHIASFARLMGETNPLHVDATFAATSSFGTIIASGSFGLALTMALIEEAEPFHGTAIAALGIDDWRYRRPITASLEVSSRMTIAALTPRGDDRSGIVIRGFELTASTGGVIQSGRSAIIVATRAAVR